MTASVVRTYNIYSIYAPLSPSLLKWWYYFDSHSKTSANMHKKSFIPASFFSTLFYGSKEGKKKMKQTTLPAAGAIGVHTEHFIILCYVLL